MSERKTEVVRRIFDAWGEGDFTVGFDDLDHNVTFVVGPEFAERGVEVGREAISEYMLEFLAQFEQGSLTIKAERIRSVGDTVVVDVVQHGKGRASGVAVDLRFFMLFTFRGGKVVRMETVMSERDAHEAAGLSE